MLYPILSTEGLFEAAILGLIMRFVTIALFIYVVYRIYKKRKN